ncbi:uncharacterized protein At5g39865-like [Andrographis paniculata]|uniref:uncharacterized protein At5g39865-like n=1 Tax=Andrographis paniculata TaxID=175694 RepID=UPI0021E9A8EF|nr:uncharacterized protein At5g39865-like [Andrographis paniculata]
MGYTTNGAKTGAAPAFNRSASVHCTSPAEDKTSLYSLSMFQRNGSVRKSSGVNTFHGKVKKLCSIFESPKKNPQHSHSLSLSLPFPTKSLTSPSESPNSTPKHISSIFFESPIRLPGTEDRVVVYFTSLRGIRRTFQDCHSVRMIFRGFRINIDERDISMDAAYKTELQKVLGKKRFGLPQVFIKGSYIGGADLIKQLSETGDLAKLVRGLPQHSMKPCDACDDARFIPCTDCNGSRKVFDEDDEQRRWCRECNENGLLRCPLCCP